MEEFKAINQNCIIAANKTAERMLKELKKIKMDYVGYRELYFACIEIYSIIYGNQTDNISIHQIIDILNELYDKKIGFVKDKHYYNIFWNTLITSNKNGEECDVDEFLKNMRMKFGENARVVCTLTTIVEKLFPNCNQIKLQTYFK